MRIASLEGEAEAGFEVRKGLHRPLSLKGDRDRPFAVTAK
jgi:hypothetical protein